MKGVGCKVWGVGLTIKCVDDARKIHLRELYLCVLQSAFRSSGLGCRVWGVGLRIRCGDDKREIQVRELELCVRQSTIWIEGHNVFAQMLKRKRFICANRIRACSKCGRGLRVGSL